MKLKYLNLTVSFQIYQVFRYGALILTSIALARLFPDKVLIARFEKLWLLGTSLSFFWISGLFDAFLPMARAADLAGRRLLSGAVFQYAVLFSLGSWVLILGAGVLSLPASDWTALFSFSVYILLSGPAWLLEYDFLMRNQPRRLLLTGVLSWLLHGLALVLPLALGYSLAVACTALAGLSLLRLVVLLLLHSGLLRRGEDNIARRDLLRAAWPLMLIVLLSGAASYLDRYLVGILQPGNSNAFTDYAYGAREFPLVQMLANAASLIAAASLSQAFQEAAPGLALRALKSSGARLMLLLFPVSAGLMLSSTWLYTRVYGPGFAASSAVFDIFLLLISSRLLFPQAIIRAKGRNSDLLVASGIELVLNFSLSIGCMFLWGLPGIAAGTVIASLIEKLILMYRVWRVDGIAPGQYTHILLWLAGMLLLCGTFLVKYALC